MGGSPSFETKLISISMYKFGIIRIKTVPISNQGRKIRQNRLPTASFKTPGSL